MRWRCASAASLLALASMSASAAEWRYEPSMSTGVDYLNNPRLRIGNDESFVGSRSDVAVDFGLSTDSSAFSFTPRLAYVQYQDDSLLDRSDKSLMFAARRDYETVAWSSMTAYTRDTTITSEFGLTGLQDVNRKHESLSMSGGPTWSISERAQVAAQIYAMETWYEDAGFTGLRDYSYALLSLNGSYVWSETITIGAQASVGELSVSMVSDRSRDIDTSLFVNWRLADQWQLRLSYGPTRVESQYGDSNGYIYSAALSKENLRSNIRVSVERDVTPTGRGVLVTRDQVALTTTYAMTPRTAWSVTAQAIRASDTIDVPGTPQQTNEFAKLETSLRWHWTEHWSLALTAGGKYLQQDHSEDHAEGFSVNLGLLWNGQPQSLTR